MPELISGIATGLLTKQTHISVPGCREELKHPKPSPEQPRGCDTPCSTLLWSRASSHSLFPYKEQGRAVCLQCFPFL